MRGQFSFEFVIDVGIALIIVAFIVVFFTSISNTNSRAVTMSGVCTLIADTINSVSNSPAPFSVDYLPLINETSFQNYTIQVSDGVIVIYLLQNSALPKSLVSNLNVVSCGADTKLTDTETFNFSNLAVAVKGENPVDPVPTLLDGLKMPNEYRTAATITMTRIAQP